ncbi:Uncharacterised protein [Chlamydia trachomatis]|nr:Uncharacterised protein [Chlamydia trachomatis]
MSLVQPFLICFQQRLPILGDGVIDGMPVTPKLKRHFFDSPAYPYLFGCPFRGPGSHVCAGRSDSWVRVDPRRNLTLRIRTFQSVFPPNQSHRLTVDRQVNIRHLWTILDPRHCRTSRTDKVSHNLFNPQANNCPVTFILQNTSIFQAHQSLKNQSRIRDSEGVSIIFSFHT